MSATYRARFRFRLQKKIDIKSNEYRLQIGGYEVVLQPPKDDMAIRDSEWLIMNTRGLPSEDAARNFVDRLRVALEVSSIAARVGVDAGRLDRATSALGAVFRQKVEQQSGAIIRPNVHGVDVFIDAPNVVIFGMSGTLSVRAADSPFLTELLPQFFDVAANASAASRDVILLLNTALMQPNAVAQIVFAFSAVEMLGQQETWSPDQLALRANLMEAARDSGIGTEAERAEVIDSIRRSHRLSLRQGVMRLLDSLGLSHLRGAWDATYAERSSLVHGLAPEPGKDYTEFAARALSLCGRILLKKVAQDVPRADAYVDRFYNV